MFNSCVFCDSGNTSVTHTFNAQGGFTEVFVCEVDKIAVDNSLKAFISSLGVLEVGDVSTSSVLDVAKFCNSFGVAQVFEEYVNNA